MTLIDGEKFEAANLVRHALDLRNVGEHKAPALAQRLRLLGTGLDVVGFPSAFADLTGDALVRVHTAEIILDCTGSDQLAHELSLFVADRAVLFTSISIGYGAQRLFVFSARGSSLPAERMWADLRPWIERDRTAFDARPPRHAGPGCWHPAFPARADDVALLAAAAVRQLEADARADASLPRLTVFEREDDGDGLVALRRTAADAPA